MTWHCKWSWLGKFNRVSQSSLQGGVTTWCRGINSSNMMKIPSFYPWWQQYNTCLTTPSVTGWGHHKIEPKTKHLSYCKKNQSSWPNQTDNSKRNTMIWNHAQKNSEKIQIIFMDNLIINPQFIRSRQTHHKRRLHWIDLQDHRG
jgi:hypothetical protein